MCTKVYRYEAETRDFVCVDYWDPDSPQLSPQPATHDLDDGRQKKPYGVGGR